MSNPKEPYDEDIDHFPDLEKYLEQLEELKKTTPDNTPFKELSDKYFDLAVILPQIIAYQKPANFNSLKLFRVRLNIDENKEDLSLIQTHSYPPSFICSENGRANLKGHSVFYCSNESMAALEESKPKIGDIAYISMWTPMIDRIVKIAHCLPIDLMSSNKWHVMANEAWQFMASYYKEKAPDKHQHFIELNKFISDRFVKEAKPYYLTSWLANEILYGEHWRDLILYPSIASDRNYCNMAIHPNFVNIHLKFEMFLKIEIIDIKNKQIVINRGPIGIVQKNAIRLIKATNKEDILFKEYGFDIGKWES